MGGQNDPDPASRALLLLVQRDQFLHGSVGVPREVVLGTGNSASNLLVAFQEPASFSVTACYRSSTF
jgi:hypothetical protein